MSSARELLDGQTTLAELRGYNSAALTALCHDALALHENGRTDEAMVMLRGLRALSPAHSAGAASARPDFNRTRGSPRSA